MLFFTQIVDLCTYKAVLRSNSVIFCWIAPHEATQAGRFVMVDFLFLKTGMILFNSLKGIFTLSRKTDPFMMHCD